MTILIVDDDPDICFFLRVLLEAAGYSVSTAADGQEALDWLAASHDRPAVILLDLLMPVMDGWAFLARQRADTALATIPVIILSVSAVDEVDQLGPPIAAVVLKPIDITSLLEAVALCNR
jgi:CheY-like chemotaxis protein